MYKFRKMMKKGKIRIKY